MVFQYRVLMRIFGPGTVELIRENILIKDFCHLHSSPKPSCKEDYTHGTNG